MTDTRIVKKFTHQSAQANLRISKNHTARLYNLYSQIRGEGHASGLMKKIVSYADEQGLCLYLDIQRYGKPPGLDNQQLAMFYWEFGFRPRESPSKRITMCRLARITRPIIEDK